LKLNEIFLNLIVETILKYRKEFIILLLFFVRQGEVEKKYTDINLIKLRKRESLYYNLHVFKIIPEVIKADKVEKVIKL
jgi:hypothetical protein